MLRFHPKQGTVLICNYEGFIVPEMVKRRRVVVISPYQQNKHGLCSVVPISTTTPEPTKPFHHKISTGKYPFLSHNKACWVKGDVINTVSLKRLDRIRVGKKFVSPKVDSDDLDSILQCVKNYLDL